MSFRALLAVLTAWLLTLGAAWSAPASPLDLFLPSTELVRLGVNLSEFAAGAISNDESMVLGHQKVTDAREIAKGHVYKLFIFRIDAAGKRVTADSLFLPLPSLEQYAWSADDRTVLCIGGYGTQVVAVDVATRTVRPVFAHERGKPGFRVSPPVLWLEKGRLHAPGYFYDAEQMTTSQAIVTIDPSRTGLAAFEPVLDIAQLLRTTAGWALEIWYATDQAYYVLTNAEGTSRGLYAFLGDQKKLRLLDRAAYRIDLAAVGQNRVVAVMRDGPTTGRAVVCDVVTNKQWRVGVPKQVYQYPYMSRDGETILLSTIDLPNRKMTTWYAHASDQFTLHPLPHMTDAFPGTIHFSRSRGSLMAFFNKDGLRFIGVP